MIFSNLLWVWLSAALLIPVFIHLWNKKTGRPRLLGTYRFLPNDTFSAARKIELHELPLLFIRGMMVITVTTLLAGLFWETEKAGTQELWIFEVEEEKVQATSANENLKFVEIASPEVKGKGWWNILEQLDYQFHPSKMTVTGNFSTDKFRGKRPEIWSQIEWVEPDSLTPAEKELAVWNSGGDSRYSFSQYKTGQAIISKIEEAGDNPQNNSLQQVEMVTLILNTDNPEEINYGLTYAADNWKIESEEQNLEEIAKIESEGRVWVLKNKKSEDGPSDFTGPNPVSGISFHVSRMDTLAEALAPILQGLLSNTPALYEENDSVLVLNGEIEKELESWVYAGVGSYLIQQSLGVKDYLHPNLSEEQREVISGQEKNRDRKERKSAGLLLFSLLLILWAAERWMAPGRGM